MITLKQERSSSGVKLSLAWRLDQEMRINIYENSRASILEKLRTSFAIDQKSELHGTSFQSSLKINCMLITRLICIQ